jgi:predicted SprT family Zn-dependent metalloprotease
MDLHKAETLALALMAKHGLPKLFSFDNSKKRFGVCRMRYNRKVIGFGGQTKTDYIFIGISLSRHLVKLNEEAEVTDTILHEIAHALTMGDGHGAKWKAKCVEIGCRPIRCYSSNEVDTPTLKYSASCGDCGTVYQRSRLPKVGRKVACKCQRGINWDNKKLLEYKPN